MTKSLHLVCLFGAEKSLIIVGAAIMLAGCASKPVCNKETAPPPRALFALRALLPVGGVTQRSSTIGGSGYQNGQVSCVLPAGVSDTYHTKWVITPGTTPTPSNSWRDVRHPMPYNPGWLAPGPYVVSFQVTGATKPNPFKTVIVKGKLNTLTVKYH